MRPGRVVHAAETLARQRVAVGEQHVGVRVVVAVARLTPAAKHHGVAIVTGGTPVLEDIIYIKVLCYLAKGI